MEMLKKKMVDGGSRKKRSEGGKKKSSHYCWSFLDENWWLDDTDRSTKDVAYASGLLPNSQAKHGSNKASCARSVNISVGGLDDDDADAVNPYSPQKSSQTVKKVVEAGKRDLSRQNEVRTCIYYRFLMWVKRVLTPVQARSYCSQWGSWARQVQ